MPRTKTPTKLQAAAADEKTKKKATGLLASFAALLGIPAPGAKMKRVTETTKHVTTEEEEEERGSAAEEEEEEEEEGSTGDTHNTDSTDTGDTHSSAAEEEEEEEEEEEGSAAEKQEFPPKKKEKSKAKSEEEEEKALARSVGKALNSAAVQKAFLAALPPRHRAEGALFSPHRLAHAAKKATGAHSTFGAMSALASGGAKNRAASAAILTKQARLETRVAKVEGSRLSERVSAIVSVAKEKGRAGATTHAGRELLRDYGMKQGTKALSAFISAQPIVARTNAKVPRGDGGTGAPSASDQEATMRAAATSGLTGDDLKFATETVNAKIKAMRSEGTET